MTNITHLWIGYNYNYIQLKLGKLYRIELNRIEKVESFSSPTSSLMLLKKASPSSKARSGRIEFESVAEVPRISKFACFPTFSVIDLSLFDSLLAFSSLGDPIFT